MILAGTDASADARWRISRIMSSPPRAVSAAFKADYFLISRARLALLQHARESTTSINTRRFVTALALRRCRNEKA